MNTFGVLGCGWLGTALALRIKGFGGVVLGTRQSDDGCLTLQSKGISGVVLPLPRGSASPIPFLGENVVIALPVSAKAGLIDEVVLVVKSQIERGAKRVVMISTTSVYGDATGVVTETTLAVPITESGKRNLAMEQALLESFPDHVKILRLSGLIGEDRHPVSVLSGRHLSHGERPVNLIHQQDAVTAILSLFLTTSSERIFHLSAFEHPSRGDYYCQQAERRGLALPIFTDSHGGDDKIIDASWTCNTLKIQLQHPLVP